MNFAALGAYCVACFGCAGLCCVVRWLLLRESQSNKLSRAAEYVPGVEIAGWVAGWYGISVTFTIVNRWVFSVWQGGFPYPILMTTGHMAVKFTLSRALFAAWGGPPEPLEPRIYWRTAAPIGVLTAMDVLLSNASLMFVTVTFYTIVKTGTLIWTLLWAVVLRLEPARWVTGVTVGLICAGLGMASWGEAKFSLPGLLLVMGAGCAGGLRWALTQLLQAADPSCKAPMTVVYHVAGASLLSMLPVMLVDFIPWVHSEFASPELILESLGMVAAGGLVAFALVATEIQLVRITSSLTLGVLGQVKELVQIGIAMAAFGEAVTPLNVAGLAIALCGAWLYKASRGSGGGKRTTTGGARAVGGGAGVEAGGGARVARYARVDQEDLHMELDALKYVGVEWDQDLSDFEDLPSAEAGHLPPRVAHEAGS